MKTPRRWNLHITGSLSEKKDFIAELVSFFLGFCLFFRPRLSWNTDLDLKRPSWLIKGQWKSATARNTDSNWNQILLWVILQERLDSKELI